MSPPPRAISTAAARRIALAAQGFGRPRPDVVTPRHLAATVDRLSLHQIDSVSVVQRAHYLPAFSRLGRYDTALLDRAAWGPKRERRLFEYWAHEASLLPLSLYPLLRWRMQEAERGAHGWKSMRVFSGERRAEADALLARIRDHGPMSASDLEDGKGAGGWWGWSEGKRILEWLFLAGFVTTATRRGNFERVYDLTERVIPPAILVLPTPSSTDAQRQLVERSARALAVATAIDLRDYFRLRPEPAQRAIAELVEDKVLEPVAVQGWSRPGYLHRDARLPRWIRGQALLAPFDPLVWERARTERLFGFRYRIEIYVPPDKRVHGYYVLPFLMDDRLVARVDLKSDRQRGVLIVRQCTYEENAPADTRERLDAELRLMADWLGLERIAWAGD